MRLRPTSTSLFQALLLLPVLATLPSAVSAAQANKAAHVYLRYDARGNGGDATTLERVVAYGINPGLASYDWGKINVGWRGDVGGALSAKPTQTAKEQETDDKSDTPPCEEETSGNPVVLYTGNKIEPELDFSTDGELGLFLRRTYNHFWNGIGLFGKHWLSNFDYSLAFSNGVAWAQRPDGRRIKFLFNATANRWNEDKPQPVAYLVKNSDGTYTLYSEEHGVETYNADGYITQLRNEQSIAWTFAYSGKYLQKVTHSSGRSVQFTWANGQVMQVTDPAGNAYQYTYTPNVFGTGRGEPPRESRRLVGLSHAAMACLWDC